MEWNYYARKRRFLFNMEKANKQTKTIKKKINIGYNEWQFMNIQSDSKE